MRLTRPQHDRLVRFFLTGEPGGTWPPMQALIRFGLVRENEQGRLVVTDVGRAYCEDAHAATVG